jgi:hypothetical protein
MMPLSRGHHEGISDNLGIFLDGHFGWPHNPENLLLIYLHSRQEVIVYSIFFIIITLLNHDDHRNSLYYDFHLPIPNKLFDDNLHTQ